MNISVLKIESKKGIDHSWMLNWTPTLHVYWKENKHFTINSTGKKIKSLFSRTKNQKKIA